MPLRAAVAVVFAAIAIGQPLTVHTPSARPVTLTRDNVAGREAWVLDNGQFRISALRGGGHLAEIRLVSDDSRKSLNPMRIPHYPTIDPNTYDPAKHDAIYGDDPHRWLSSGYMGHLLCFPIYGPPSADEARAGLGNHGEAPIVEWKEIGVERQPNAITLRYGADLPKTQFRVERAITLRAGDRFARVEEWVENLANFDRPVNWMQHATFGPPFVEPGKTIMDVAAHRGLVTRGRPESASLKLDSPVEWPNGTSIDGAPVDLRRFQRREHAGTYVALLLDTNRPTQFFTMRHSEYRFLIGYAFPAEGNPWIADWQENRSNRQRPWNGQVIARGVEWGSSPFAEGLRNSVERGQLFGAPTYRWIGGRQRLKTEFVVFVVEIPDGFPGVRDVTLDHGAPVIVPR